MFYLVHAGKYQELAAISSVSGGSITNGVLAHEPSGLASVGNDQFVGKFRHLIQNVAHVGLYFWGPRTNGYVRTTLSLAGLAMVRLLTTLVWTAVTGLRLDARICLVITVFLMFLAVAAFGSRSIKTNAALAAEHFQPQRDGDAPGGRQPDHHPRVLRDRTAAKGAISTCHRGSCTHGRTASECLDRCHCRPLCRRRPACPGRSRRVRCQPGRSRSAVARPGRHSTTISSSWTAASMTTWPSSGCAGWRRGSAGPRQPEQLPVDEIIVVNASALPGFRLARMKRSA
jgi:hypothetical protein